MIIFLSTSLVNTFNPFRQVYTIIEETQTSFIDNLTKVIKYYSCSDSFTDKGRALHMAVKKQSTRQQTAFIHQLF